MTGEFWPAFWIGLGPTVTSIVGAYLVIRQTNQKTEKKGDETNQLVIENKDATLKVGQGVDGNLEELNRRLNEQTEEIRRLHQAAVLLSAKTATDTLEALNKKEP